MRTACPAESPTVPDGTIGSDVKVDARHAADAETDQACAIDAVDREEPEDRPRDQHLSDRSVPDEQC